MTNIDQKTDELKAQVRENLAERDDVYYALGNFLLRLPAEPQEPGLLEEQKSSALEHSERIPSLEASIEEISRCEQELQELKAVDADVKARKSTCKENLELLQETLGEELYHQLHSMNSPPWESAYLPVTEQINKIRDHDTELFQLENQVTKKNLLNNMLYKSRISLLKSRKKSLESSLGKLYKKGFSDALDLGAGQSSNDSPDATLLIPWFRTDEDWKGILQEEEELENRKRLNRDRLKELCEGKGPKKKKEALNREIEREKELLKDSLIKIGEGVCGDPGGHFSSLPEVVDAVGKIDRLTEAGIALNLEIEKWEAKKDIGKLEHDKEYMIGKITALDEEIQARRQEIKVLKKEISKVSADIEKKQAFAADLPEE